MIRATRSILCFALLSAVVSGCLPSWTIDHDAGIDAHLDSSTDGNVDDHSDVVLSDMQDMTVVDSCGELDHDVHNCGRCGHDCTLLPHVTSTVGVACLGGACMIPPSACAPGFAHCSSDPDVGCEVAINTPDHCGTCTNACPGTAPYCVPTATPTDGGVPAMCAARCPDTARDSCNMTCTNLQTDPNECGSCGHGCPSPLNGIAQCSAGTCAFGCMTGFHACGMNCSDSTSTDSCGGNCSPCRLVPNAVATCNGTVCGFRCNVGFAMNADGCVAIPSPRPIAPMSTSFVNSGRPVLSWFPIPNATMTRIEVCSTRDCAHVESTMNSATSPVTVSTVLSPGVHFWRVSNVFSDGSTGAPSVVWEFFVKHGTTRPAGVESSFIDINGDGIADTGVAYPNGNGAFVQLGGGGVNVQINTPSGNSSWITGAGDFDGDGIGDVVVSASDPFGGLSNTIIEYGSATGAFGRQLQLPSHGGSSTGVMYGSPNIAGVGDFNGDGYGDVAVGTPDRDVSIYLGSPGGLSGTQTYAGDHGGSSVAGAGDYNGDGLADFVTASTGAPQVDLFLGNPAGSLTPIRLAVPPSTNGGGIHLSNAHDVNGDGFSDVLVDELITGSTVGIFVFYGASTPPTSAAGMFGHNGDPVAPRFIAGFGDVNGDGFDDVAWTVTPTTVEVHLGSAAGLSPSPSATLNIPQVISAGGGGDSDGDGFSDAVFSQGGGQAIGYHGSATGLMSGGVSFPPMGDPGGVANTGM